MDFEMTRRRIAAAIFCLLPMMMADAADAQASPDVGSADLIMNNARVRTPAGWVEAMAIRDGTIVGVGPAKSLDRLRGPDTKILDLGRATVLPGLHDSHVHPVFAGLEQFACGFEPGARPEAIAAAVKRCAARTPAGEWIQGGNWVAAVFAEGQQDKAFLDAITREHPVILSDEAHHSAWVNSKALELAGISRATPNPPGGIIERDASGEPNGLLRETATTLVEKVVPQPSDKAMREALVLASNQMLSFGITSYTVASIRGKELAAFAALARDGEIKQRVRGCMVWEPGPDGSDPAGEALIRSRQDYAGARFTPDCVKIFLDGVPTESHTGAMLEPYADAHAGHGDNRPEKGILMIPQPLLDKAVADFDRQGLHMKFHAAGDAAVRAAIDAVAAARRVNGFGGPMHDVGHSTFVSREDIPRVREVQMAWEFSPYIWYPTPMASIDVRKAVGDERMERWVPLREAIDTGALVVAGSDWSVVPSVNPWLAMETLVTRQKPGGSEETLGEQERISLEEAFRLFTTSGAALMGHRDRVGSIEPGMRADLVVTETNPFEAPITSLHSTRVRMTFVDGEKVYDAASPPRLSAR